MTFLQTSLKADLLFNNTRQELALLTLTLPKEILPNETLLGFQFPLWLDLSVQV